MGVVKNGPYGWYYCYVNSKGQERFQNIPQAVYDKYYAHGYLTDSHLESIVEHNKTVTFCIPKKNGDGQTTVTAKLVPHISRAGKKCKRIDFESDESIDDIAIIKANLEKIALAYWNNDRFDWSKPQKILDTLPLDKQWKTYAKYTTLNNKPYGWVKIYQPYSKSNNEFCVYLTIDGTICKVIDESTYKAAEKTDTENRQKVEDERNRKKTELIEVYKNINKWLDSFIQIGNTNIVNTIGPYVENISFDRVSNRVISYLRSTGNVNLSVNKIIADAKNSLKYNITIQNYNDLAAVNNFKIQILENLKVAVEYYRIIEYRLSLLDRCNKEGLSNLTDSINIDTALNLGYFNQVKRALTNFKRDAPDYIIMKMYPEELDLHVLEDRLLNMLKVYYDFYDFPEKDRKAIAKFIAVHKQSEYYEQISKFDDVVEVLIDNSRDPKLTKPILESIAGTSRASMLKNKTYYFEKRGRLRKNYLINRPMELLDGLRDCIKIFNSSSGVAILTNIELDTDESFIFQFYTFANGEGDSSGFDGRRMLNLTRIYNKSHNPKISFYFEHEEDSDTEDDS